MTTTDSASTEGLPDTASSSLHDRRPELVKTAIDKAWQNMQKRPLKGYSYHGTVDEYVFIGSRTKGRIHSDAIIEEQVRKLGRPLRILDIGCGMGRMVANAQKQGHDAQGLTANNYHGDRRVQNAWLSPTELPELRPGSYVQGDANNLDKVSGLYDEYDLIVSRLTFMHLVDPLGALEQAVDRLAVGGVIAVNDISAPYRRKQQGSKGVDGRFVVNSVWQSGLDVLSNHEGLSDEIFVATEVIASKSTADTVLTFGVIFEELDQQVTQRTDHPTGWEYARAA